MTIANDAIELIVEARPRDIGAFAVRRALPSVRRRHAGPFVFFDHMGPAVLAPGSGMDVRPHPHIELATVTYLFEGEIDHRDSLGTFQTIRPGDVNWMIAGKGIVHSERSGAESRARGPHIHGIQSWVALPLEHERTDPRFEHHPSATIPKIARDGVKLEIVAGTAYGVQSPVGVLSRTLYVHSLLEKGATLEIDNTHEERAIYVVEGTISCAGDDIPTGTLAFFRTKANVEVTAKTPVRAMIVGGGHLEGERHIDWNFVSSSLQRIEQAKDDWENERFPKVPGDELERIPLPERVHRSHDA